MAPGKRRPTIDDVAARSGVARVTVSRVINGGPNVRAEIRERVMAAVDALGYRVNAQARNLAAGTARQIILLFEWNADAEPNSYYHAGLELGALTAASQHGYELSAQMVGTLAADWRERVVAMLQSRRADGCLLPPPFADDEALLAAISAAGCPFVCISAGDKVRARVPSIGIDDVAAGYDIARFIVGLGHRNIGYIKGIAGHLSAEGRFAGFARALAEAGLPLDEGAAVRGNFTFHSGIECCDALLDRRPGVTAIICGNDDMAAGALLACHRRGLSIPGDVSVAGCDNSPVSEIVWPPLTTVHQPVKDIAQQAVRRLLLSIEARLAPDAPLADFIEHRIISRQSTGAPSGRQSTPSTLINNA